MFSVTYPIGPREAVAKAVRDGDHHKKGEHTQLDQAREFIAESVEHTEIELGHDDAVSVSVEGSHSSTERHLSIDIYVAMAEDIDYDAYPNPPGTPTEA